LHQGAGHEFAGFSRQKAAFQEGRQGRADAGKRLYVASFPIGERALLGLDTLQNMVYHRVNSLR
jgi:hypothetical protein